MVGGPVVRDPRWCCRRCSCRSRSWGGLTGQLYRQFALTLAVSVVLSAICALTLTPALCALLLRPARDGLQRRSPLALFYRGFNLGFEGFRRGYLHGGGSAGAPRGAGVPDLRRAAGRAVRAGKPAADRAGCPTRTRDSFFGRGAAATRRFDAAHRGGLLEDRSDCRTITRPSKAVAGLEGFNLLTGISSPYNATVFIRPEGRGPSASASPARGASEIQPRVDGPYQPRHQGRAGTGFQSAADPRPGYLRRLRVSCCRTAPADR